MLSGWTSSKGSTGKLANDSLVMVPCCMHPISLRLWGFFLVALQNPWSLSQRRWKPLHKLLNIWSHPWSLLRISENLAILSEDFHTTILTNRLSTSIRFLDQQHPATFSGGPPVLWVCECVLPGFGILRGFRGTELKLRQVFVMFSMNFSSSQGNCDVITSYQKITSS